MKRFVIDIVLVIGLLLVVNMGVDFYLSRKLQYSRSEMLAGWNDILHTDISADIIILGSSRAMVQYDPYILDSILCVNSYNLGVNGGAFNSQYPKYLAYLEYQKKPKNVIVNVDYHCTLQYTDEFEREAFFPFIINPTLRKFIQPAQTFSWGEWCIPNYRYLINGGDMYFYNRYSENAHMYKGFIPREQVWNGEVYKEQPLHIMSEVDKRTRGMFEDFLEKAYRDSIKVIFCFAPIYIGYTERIDNLDEIYSLFGRYADKYEIPILDYTYSEISYDTTFFYNATHMNKRGVEIFCVKLANDIDSMALVKEK